VLWIFVLCNVSCKCTRIFYSVLYNFLIETLPQFPLPSPPASPLGVCLFQEHPTLRCYPT
jgi:hypothetical protein